MQDSQRAIPTLTSLLNAWRGGDGAALAGVLDCAYAELRRIAAQRLAQANGAATLTPTELLHESALPMLEGTTSWHSRAHFNALMSLCMWHQRWTPGLPRLHRGYRVLCAGAGLGFAAGTADLNVDLP